VGAPALVLVGWAAGCANSGLGQTTDTDTDNPPEGTCPWVGTWTLTTISCGSIEATEWFDSHTSSTLVLSHAAAGGCDGVVTTTGPSCTRTEAWSFPAPASADVSFSLDGITSCVPNACLFEPYGASCAIGGLTGSTTVTITATGSTLLMVTPVGSLGPLTDTIDCPLEVGTEWTVAR
jgi:hypothetical protein